MRGPGWAGHARLYGIRATSIERNFKERMKAPIILEGVLKKRKRESLSLINKKKAILAF